jgi:hypothetical protein
MVKTAQQPATIAKIVDECIDEVLSSASICNAAPAAYEAGGMYVDLNDEYRRNIKIKVKEKILDYLGF